VRSSATTEDLATASFAGQQETYINIKGTDALISAVKKCFASLFTARAIYYRERKGFSHDKALLAVIIQKMIDSDKSGVVFSQSPTGNPEDIVIEAVFGQGEGIVSGRIKPDEYIVNRKTNIIKKMIAEKEIAIVRDSSGETKEVALKPEKARSQVLTENEIKKLASYALHLEDHYKIPQDVEFAIERGEIYIVQTRPVTTLGKKLEKPSIKEGGVAVLAGLAASQGIAVGPVKIIYSLKDLAKIQKGDILVTKMTNPDMVVTMQKCSGIITDEGGITAHAAIVSREMGIPAVVGTEEATQILKDGEIITLDGFDGKIYSGKVAEAKEKEILQVIPTLLKIKVNVDLPSAAQRAAQTGIKAVGLCRIEDIIAEHGKHPLAYLQQKKVKDYEDTIYKGVKIIAQYFDDIWVRTSDIRTDEFQNLEGAQSEKEANPMLGMHGIRFGIKNPEILKAELNAFKRVAKDTGKKIGIMMPQVISVEELQKTKKLLNEGAFPENISLGIMVETPAAVQIIQQLCEEGIVFVSFGTNDLTQYTLAIDRGNSKVQHLYNEMHPAILSQLKYSIEICKAYGVETSICGQAGSKKEMVKFLYESGIDGISVNADSAHDISLFVQNLEQIKPQELEENKYYEINAGEISSTNIDSLPDKGKETEQSNQIKSSFATNMLDIF
jgi:pyruvate,water dikinase